MSCLVRRFAIGKPPFIDFDRFELVDIDIIALKCIYCQNFILKFIKDNKKKRLLEV